MRSFVSTSALVTLVAITAGCTRTYISTGDPGMPSPDGDTRLILTAHGAYGRSYLDRTRKLLDVLIVRGPATNEQTLFDHRYKFQGADLWANAQWTSTNNVQLTVFDYPPGTARQGGRNTGAPSNYISTLSFQLDRKSGKFEQVK